MVALISAVIGSDLLPSPPRDLQIWPGEITGLSPHGDYAGLTLGYDASIAPGTDLTGSNLANAYLSSKELVDLRLDSASLGSAILSYSAFFGTSLRHVEADAADMASAILFGADMHGADLSAAYFWSAEVSGAQLSRRCLHG